METALLQGLSLSLDELETHWIEDLRKRMTWMTYAIHHLYEILFFMGSLLLIIGFIRYLIRKRTYAEEDPFAEGDL